METSAKKYKKISRRASRAAITPDFYPPYFQKNYLPSIFIPQFVSPKKPIFLTKTANFKLKRAKKGKKFRRALRARRKSQ